MNQKLFNRYFIGITLINFFIYLVYYLLMVIIAFVAQKNFDASIGQAGFATGIYVIGTLLARLIMGKQIELLGRNKVIKYSALFYLITTVLYLFIPSISILYLIRFLNGIGYGLVSTATNTIVTAYIPKDQQGKGINYYGLSTALAAAAGPFLGMLLLNVTSFPIIISVCITITVAVFVVCLVFPTKNITLNNEQTKKLKSWNLNSFIEKRAIFISVMAFIMGISYSSVLTFLSSYTKELNLTVAGTFFFVVYALCVSITRPVTGSIFDSRGEKYVLYPSYLFLTVGLILLGCSTTSVTILVAGAIIGLGYGTFMSNGQAVCLKIVEEARIGVALSTYFIGLDLGLGVGPYIMGTIKSFIPYKEMYITASILPVVCILCYFIYNIKNNKI